MSEVGVHDARSVHEVLSVIQASLSNENLTRSSAESALRAWESDAAPGFLVSLLKIVEQHQAIDPVSCRSSCSCPHPAWAEASASVDSMAVQAIRLLAAVIAKNAVGSSWRKTLGTREWSRVPDDEKLMCKEATIQLMLTGK